MEPESYKSAIELLSTLKQAGLFEAKQYDPWEKWIPALSSLASVTVGAVAAWLPTYISTLRKEKKEAESIANAIKAEISAFLAINRDYLFTKMFRHNIETLKEENKLGNESSMFSDYYGEAVINHHFEYPHKYDEVYQKHIEKLGLLEPSLAKNIVQFYATVPAFQNFIGKDGGLMKIGTIKSYRTACILNERLIIKGALITQEDPEDFL